LLPSADQTVGDTLPRAVFATPESANRFRFISLKHVLAMSALDAPVAPHFSTAEAKERQLKFVSSPNRLKFALAQSLLPRPGTDFLYTDITPLIAAGAVQHATKETLLDFDKAALFGPMGFRNEEWMHQDSARIDNASYGLRMRPIDMQKFGILYLHEGCWNGHRLLSREWVQTSFTSWIRSRPGNRNPNYGWYWWKNWFAFGWVGHVANGWKGQRIAVLPDKNMVVSMTALVHDVARTTFSTRSLINSSFRPRGRRRLSPPSRFERSES